MAEIFGTFLKNSVLLSIPAVLLMALSPVLARRYSAKCRYYVSLALFAAMLLPVRPHVLFTPPEFLSGFFGTAETSALTQTGAVSQATQATQATHGFNWFGVIGIIWAVGAALFIGWHIYNHMRFMKAVKRWNERVFDEKVIRLFRQTKALVGVHGKISLRVCHCIKTPMIVGFFRSMLLLPSTDIPIDELEAILKHELIHYKRGDLYFKALAMLTLAIHWFNPVTHIFFHSVCALCEISCDEAALRGADEKTRARYGEAIIGIIRRGGAYQTTFSSNFYSGSNGVKKRIYALMDTGGKRFSFIFLGIICVFALCCVTAFAVAPVPARIEAETPSVIQTSEIENGTAPQQAQDYHAANPNEPHGTQIDMSGEAEQDEPKLIELSEEEFDALLASYLASEAADQ